MWEQVCQTMGNPNPFHKEHDVTHAEQLLFLGCSRCPNHHQCLNLLGFLSLIFNLMHHVPPRYEPWQQQFFLVAGYLRMGTPWSPRCWPMALRTPHGSSWSTETTCSKQLDFMLWSGKAKFTIADVSKKETRWFMYSKNYSTSYDRSIQNDQSVSFDPC